MDPDIQSLSEHLLVHAGSINVGIVRDGSRALLIDCGNGDVATALRDLGVTTVDQVVFTHHHRDQACGAGRFAGAAIGVPETEREAFEKPSAYWSDPKHRWHIYHFHPHHLMLTQPLRVDAGFADGHVFTWGPARIRVLATPGHTDGSVSYLVAVDGRRVMFCGDAIYDHGRLWDLHSLQHSMGRWGDYHGFLGALPALTRSLRRIQAEQPDRLVPSHGHSMNRPAEAIDAVIARLEVCYEKYTAISALRHYDRDVFGPDEGKGRMPFCPALPVPENLRHFGTTWVLIARDKSALVMDCGNPAVVDDVKQLMASGAIRAVEGLWITHYHDDHVDAVPAFQAAFDCPCLADRAVADVIADPLAWRLPCISPAKVRVDRVTADGESWQWHEYRLTAYTFPGQTLYHGGLLAEADGQRLFFVGDSFAPSGIDDYCAQNRIQFGVGIGLDRCVALLQQLRPALLFNPHVDSAFVFSDEQYAAMRANLAEREALMGDLLPWDHPNYGLDDSWVRCHPYEQRARAGTEATLEVVVTNHSAVPRAVACRPVLPWSPDLPDWTHATLPAKTEGRLHVAFRIPPDQASGRTIIPIDIRYEARWLPQFAEAVLEV
jgi:glyoxylase-like metal-dependent hydrolase (beta-lactamase superfamily II)